MTDQTRLREIQERVNAATQSRRSITSTFATTDKSSSTGASGSH